MSRVGERPEAELYPFSVREPIPLFHLPLQPGDQEPIVDLNQLIANVYDEAALALVIDYSKPPIPSL